MSDDQPLPAAMPGRRAAYARWWALLTVAFLPATVLLSRWVRAGVSPQGAAPYLPDVCGNGGYGSLATGLVTAAALAAAVTPWVLRAAGHSRRARGVALGGAALLVVGIVVMNELLSSGLQVVDCP